MKNVWTSWLVGVCAAAGFGCSSTPATQVITGNLDASTSVAVRAVANDAVVTAARVRTDGTFTLSLPAGKQYRLEVMTASGAVRPIAASSGGGMTAIAFKVCQPGDPWDMGGVGGGGGRGAGSGTGTGTGTGTGGPHGGPGSGFPPPPPCDPSTTANCPPPPCADPTDPNTCQDPCMGDPSQCACPTGGSGSADPDGCWPPPLPQGDCGNGMTPDHPPGDFGCSGSGSAGSGSAGS